jgi:hypothetical protein
VALTKFNYNSFDVTTAASSGLSFNSSANGFTTASSSALNLIATNTISSGVSSSSFTSGISSTYDTYLFKFINIHCATEDADFSFTVSTDGGSGYGLAKTSTVFRAYHTESDNSATVDYVGDFDLAQGTGVQNLGINQGIASDDSLSGEMYLFSPSNTTFVKHFIARTNNNHASGNPGSIDGYYVGYVNSTSAINAIQFKMSSGNIDSGVIKMYGITK